MAQLSIYSNPIELHTRYASTFAAGTSCSATSTTGATECSTLCRSSTISPPLVPFVFSQFSLNKVLELKDPDDLTEDWLKNHLGGTCPDRK